MNPSPLVILHQQFELAIKRGYIGASENSPAKLVKTDKKEIRLNQVFQLAKKQIEANLKKPDQLDPTAQTAHLKREVTQLRALEEDGKRIYERYQKSTATWTRLFLKVLSLLTPSFLKRFLPSCFANGVRAAEAATKQAYEDYRSLVTYQMAKRNIFLQTQENIDNYERAQMTKRCAGIKANPHVNPLDADEFVADYSEETAPSNVEETVPLPEPLVLTKEEIEKNLRKAVNDPLEVHFKFAIRNVAGQQIPLNEKELRAYSGKIQVSSLPGDLMALAKFVNEHPSCRPSAIEIQIDNQQELTSNAIKLLLTLSDCGAEISLTGLEELNFNEMESEAELQLIAHLDRFAFPQLKNMVLAERSKQQWTPYLISQFSPMTSIDLSGLSLSDQQLGQWIASGFLANATTLRLDNCKELTTDILHSLFTLPALTKLFLPDLPRGDHPLSKLRTFDNPFKIKLFYTSKATQEIAAELYTGPLDQASIFQIPLARQGASKIFPPRMKILDPTSASYWLKQSDYQNLPSQNSVEIIQVESNEDLRDDNLLDFVEKFPQAHTLSLDNCPNITSKGVHNMLKGCRHIKCLNLTDCPTVKIKAKSVKIEVNETTLAITDEELSDEGSLERILKEKDLSKLRRINLSGCTKLTNQMLAPLFDHLTAAIWMPTNDDRVLIDNPQRLNLAVLNLPDCPTITEEVFHKGKEGNHIDLLPLGNLVRIIIKDEKINAKTKELYSPLVFKEMDDPAILQIDPELSLRMCQEYYGLKNNAAQNGQKKISPTELLKHRTVIELFAFVCHDQEAVEKVRSFPIDTNADEFKDFTLTFKAVDAAPPVTFLTYRSLLSSNSTYFRNRFRAGGWLSQMAELPTVQQHATPKAAQALMDLLYHRDKIIDFSGARARIKGLDWKTAADAAELAGAKCFEFPPYIVQALLDHFHSQFDMSRAENMFLAARALGDHEGKKLFEKILLTNLEPLERKIETQIELSQEQENLLIALGNLAREENLEKLNDRIAAIREALNEKLQQSLIEKDAREDQAQFNALEAEVRKGKLNAAQIKALVHEYQSGKLSIIYA